MQELQCKAVAAGFIHALRRSPKLRDQWYEVRKKSDWNGLRELIGTTLGLAQTPTQDDLETMSAHSLDHLFPQLQELHALDDRMEPNCIHNGADKCPPLPGTPP